MEFETKILDERDTGLLEDFYIHYSIQTGMNINLKLDHSPDIWASFTTLGHETRILAAIEKNKKHIACACAVSLKECYIGGSLYTIGYMSSMKARREYRGSLAFARIMALFDSYWKEANAACWLFSVFTGNATLNTLMGRRRVFFPKVEILSVYNTYIHKPSAIRFSVNRVSETEIRYAGPKDVQRIEDFLKRQFIARDFIPAYTKEELFNGKGLLKDFSIQNLALAIEEDKVTGMAGLWDQSNFRRWFIESYSKPYRIFRSFYNLGALISQMPLLPIEKDPIRYQLMSLLLVENDQPDVFTLLYRFLVGHVSEKCLISVGMAEQHPFNFLFAKRCFKMKNNLYIGYRKENAELIRSIRKDKIYIEQGGL
jgi:hypothetical protein